ncbi:MAG: hypothetical protein KKE62_01730 [Proteobacteria bacterium]|nr:hypothetical protein [Pseudomonadota bacterium]MBU1387142.1 hypothetical protein [Pseudomonadota bacterium]MBU1541541.1 hypothetical protein [Pseudomonadota bacterium]MBU2431774.1 hypothetical protein [Pseudomonadota bacterium]MBU2480047.1 hypothetical protein [Pseudomonadota bacterium]
MRIVREIIAFEEVVDEFMDVGEDITDLSLIRMSFIKDTHYDSFELSMEIFGGGDPDEVGPVLELYIDLDSLITEEQLFQGIEKHKIPTLFDPDLLEELIGRNVPIKWNEGDETQDCIDLSAPEDGFLLAMLR